MGKLASSSDYVELPTTTLNSSRGMVPSTSRSTYIEMPTTNSSTSTSSGMPTTTSNHTNVTSLHSLTQTEEGLSREGDESEDGSEIYQAFGLHPEGSSEDAAAADDAYYTR